jgi:hypothetical protein
MAAACFGSSRCPSTKRLVLFVGSVFWATLCGAVSVDAGHVKASLRQRKSTFERLPALRSQSMVYKERDLQSGITSHAPIRIQFDTRLIESRLGESESMDTEIFAI